MSDLPSPPTESPLSTREHAAPAAGESLAAYSRTAVQKIARLTDAMRSHNVLASDSFNVVLAAVGDALDDPTSGDRTLVWEISADGTRMRQVSPEIANSGWVPADGAVAQVLGARQSIEMGLVVVDPNERAMARSATDEQRELERAFGRFQPVMDGSRIVAVIGMVRRAGRPMFEHDDRVLLDAAVERLESALRLRRATDQVASERNRGVVHSAGLLLSNDLLRDLGQISGDLVIRHLFHQGTAYVSEGIEAATGYAAAEIMADPGLLDRIIHPDDRHLLTEFIAGSDRGKPILIRLLRRDGRIGWHFVRIRPVFGANQQVIGFEGLSTDVTVMKMAEAELAHQARSDALTGLSNRLNFREATTRAIARIERHPGKMAVLFLDLDGFKQVNDTLGHPAGDEVLRQVADRLRRVIRREDLVARFGGDEFAVLLAQIRDSGEAAATARRILEALEKPIMVGDHRASISSGVGIAVADSAAADTDELISRADIALYQAKRGGRGRWQIFEGAAGTTTTVQLTLDPQLTDVPAVRPGPVVTEATLRSALAGSEFRVHYLPEVDAETSAIVGVEALVRWQHPEFGLLAAESFIDAARTSGVIDPIGDWVIREASRQVGTWRALHGIDLSLWVNVCAEQLQREGFAESVLEMLSATDFPPSSFGLDVAEVDFAAIDSVQERSLSTLSRAGVKLAIDDFGHGSSSLRSLRKLPLAQLKIGRSTISTLTTGAHGDTLLPLTIKLADSLGARVVAIGVERYEQLQLLRGLQCSMFQGQLAGDVQTAEQLSSRFNSGQLTIPGLNFTDND